MSSKYSHVREHPNIDDLMCAGMSSGPAKVLNAEIDQYRGVNFKLDEIRNINSSTFTTPLLYLFSCWTRELIKRKFIAFKN